MEISLLKAITLGVIQGVTEWLPISSSGHLAASSVIFGYKENMAYDTLLHLATLLVVVFYFRKDIWDILKNRDVHTVTNVVIATIPVTIIGLLFKDHIETAFATLPILGTLFILNGYILRLNIKAKSDHTKVSKKEALVVGLAQIAALLPGISRSGVTIIAGNKQGIDPAQSAKFSFLIAIPTILGAFILNLDQMNILNPDLTLIYVVGFMSAVISGYLSLTWLMWIVKKSKLHDFAYYSWAAGLVLLAYSLIF